MKSPGWLFTLAAAIATSSAAANRDMAVELLKRATGSAERLQTNSAEWEVRVTFPGKPASGRIRVLKDGQRTRFSGDLLVPGQQTGPLFRVFSESNIWYVVEPESTVKCRPWEHYFQVAVSELMIEAAELRFVNDAALLAASTATSTNDTSIEFRYQLNEHRREEISAIVRELNDALPAIKNTRRTNAEALTQFLRRTTNGISFRINREAGFLDRWETPSHTVEVSRFRWLSASPTNRIRIAEAKWQDKTDPFRGADWNRCVFVGHDPSAEDGETARIRISPRLGILRLDTGLVTRAPLPGLGALFGCFLPDRRSTLVVYQDGNGESGMARVNLQTSEVTPIEMDVAGQLLGMPVLSPDKRKVGLLHRPTGGRSVLDFQMLLLDLDTQTSKPWGKAGRLGGPFSWLPDGSGIVLKRFVETPGSDVEDRILCVLRLDGSMVDLRRGDTPLVLRRSNSILFEQGEREWFTCDLDGRNVKMFGRGMREWGTPAASPDESEMLWVKFAPPKLPQMQLFRSGTDSGKPAVKALGFTGHPVW